ncbi:MAG TPA: polymorphic toxin-type HINT domain-containing protein, partial [Planctomycetaceae bacterium]|nr:polymorphic toxin-type HINT domain-containing protein [Planctomycetaceae bacterium]
QTGYLQTGDSWRRYDAPADSATTSELMQRYREARYPLIADDYKSQLHVAQWCHRHGLTGQEYAHLTAAFSLAPASELEAIANRLGYRQVGGHWLNREELADLAASAKQTEIGLKLWGKKVERVANQLNGGPHQRETALASLQEITDPAAIPAMELSLASKDQHDAVVAIEAIARIDAYQASSALARHAVFSPWPAVRESAIDALKSRRFEDFVPSLLELLAPPVTAHQRVIPGLMQDLGFGRKRGELFYTQILVRETMNRIEANALVVPEEVKISPMMTIVMRRNFTTFANTMVGISGPPIGENIASAEPRNQALREATDRLHRREQMINAQNESTEQLNRRVTDALAAVSQQPQNTDPKFWWDWWYKYSDLQRVRPKAIAFAAETSRPVPVSVVVPEVHVAILRPIDPGRSTHSCFKAGTPVWTDTGMVPIERLQIGDRVLSQNVETGELAYKPVLYKSLRPKKQLLRVSAGGEDLVCTGGHRFWVAGEAWTKARELTPEDLLHTATGTIRVNTISEADTDETHNLVVADFHSYFVGKQAILVQDLPLPRSTNCVVPGLPPEW